MKAASLVLDLFAVTDEIERIGRCYIVVMITAVNTRYQY